MSRKFGIGTTDAAALLGMSERTLTRKEKQGEIHCERDSEGRRRFSLEEIARVRRLRQRMDGRKTRLEELRQDLADVEKESAAEAPAAPTPEPAPKKTRARK